MRPGRRSRPRPARSSCPSSASTGESLATAGRGCSPKRCGGSTTASPRLDKRLGTAIFAVFAGKLGLHRPAQRFLIGGVGPVEFRRKKRLAGPEATGSDKPKVGLAAGFALQNRSLFIDCCGGGLVAKRQSHLVGKRWV